MLLKEPYWVGLRFDIREHQKQRIAALDNIIIVFSSYLWT